MLLRPEDARIQEEVDAEEVLHGGQFELHTPTPLRVLAQRQAVTGSVTIKNLRPAEDLLGVNQPAMAMPDSIISVGAINRRR